MTNYDRIRNMSIEEMAIMLADEIPHGDCYGCDLCCNVIISPHRLRDDCQEGWLKWLESEENIKTTTPFTDIQSTIETMQRRTR